MTTLVQPVSSDGYVVQDVTTYISGGNKYLTVEGVGAGGARYMYLYWNRPFNLGVNVGYCTFRLRQRGAATGFARVLTARALAAPGFKESTLNYTNKPGVTGPSSSSASQGDGGANGRLWEIDLTAIMQAVSTGGQAWYGIRIESNNTTMLTFFSSEADDWRPEIEIEFSDAPEIPTQLSPSNGRAVSIARPPLRMDFTDEAGDTTLAAVRIVMNLGGESLTPSVDTGDVPAEVPEWVPNFDIGLGADWWWAGEVVDGAGLRSGLSDWTNFTRTAKPTVTIDSPAGSVTEPTPPLIASVTGGTQTAYQWFLTDPVDPSIVLWTGKKVTSADLGTTLPARNPPLMTPGGEYGLLRRTWDNVIREGVPGDPIYVDTFTTFTYDLSNTVAPAASIGPVEIINGRPAVDIPFEFATAPDEITLLCDGTAIDTRPSIDLHVSGTTYNWSDLLAQPYRSHNWSVAAVVNGVTSDANPTASGMAEPVGVWLSTLDGEHAIKITTEGSKPVRYEPSELSVVREPPGGRNPVLITQAVFGRKADVDGFAKPDDLQTLDEIRASWTAMFDINGPYRGKEMALTDVDHTMRVIVYNVLDTPKHEYVGKFGVQFRFFELR